MKKKSVSLLAVVFLFAALAGLLLSSCRVSDQANYPVERAKEGDAADIAPADPGSRTVPVESNIVGVSDVRHLIRTGYMVLTVKDSRETAQKVQEIVDTAEGIISSSRIYEIREGQFVAELILRVPVTRFDQVMGQLQELGKASDINTQKQDVTMQYLELDERIKNFKAQEERLREILKMADNVEDVLAVEKELARVRGEIEVMTAQFTYLQDQVGYSTINLYIREEQIATQTISPAPFENLGNRMKEALVRTVNLILAAFAGLLVVLTATLPALFIVALIVLIVWRLIARAVRRKVSQD